jgi:endonuclease YncB( thermonuclease family)
MASDVGVATLQSARTNVQRSLAGARDAFETVRARAPVLRWPKMRHVALGALLLLVAGSLVALLATRSSDRGPEAVSDAGVASSTQDSAAAPELNTTASTAAPADPNSVQGVPEVLDTSTLWLQDKLVRLFGVEWGRGGSADDLTQYLRGRAVTCRPVPGAETYRCQVDGQDLSKVVLFNGGGKSTAEATPDLKAAEEHARSARLGVWAR